MKCNFCGSNLGIEDEFCPHCGKPNDQFEGNRAEMKEYKEEFEKTKEEVKESSKTNSRIGRLIVIGVLSFIIIAMLIGIHDYSDFDTRERNRNKRIEDYVSEHKDEIDAKLIEFEDNRDYLAMDYFVLNYRLRSNSDYYPEYGKVFAASIQYRVIHDDILNIMDGYDGYENLKDRDWCDNIAKYILDYDVYVQPEYFNPDSPLHETGHAAYIKDCRVAIQDMVQAYFDLTYDQANGMWLMGKDDLCDMLYSKCMDLYPEEE